MLKLGVNIDHVATLREARYRGRGLGEPDPSRPRGFAKPPARTASPRICAKTGGTSRTATFGNCAKSSKPGSISKWPMRRKSSAIALKLKPDIVCLVPERRQEVTTEGGLDVVAAEKALTETRKKMNDAGIEVSLFIAPDEKQIEASRAHRQRSSSNCTPAHSRKIFQMRKQAQNARYDRNCSG